MITVKRQDALKWIKDGRLPENLAGKITVVMSRRHAKKWLLKLEDGTQKQTKRRLYDPKSKGFCCLGLEQACNWDGKVEANRMNGYPKFLPSLKYLRSTGKMYFDFDGTNSTDPALSTSVHVSLASEMNDGGFTFKSIAALLRSRMAVYD